MLNCFGVYYVFAQDIMISEGRSTTITIYRRPRASVIFITCTYMYCWCRKQTRHSANTCSCIFFWSGVKMRNSSILISILDVGTKPSLNWTHCRFFYLDWRRENGWYWKLVSVADVGPKPSLYRTLCRCFYLVWWEATGYMIIGESLWLLQPLILR